jgi:hydrogenase expression/formation protein HypE
MTERITLAHGNGGHFMRQLIEQVFARHLANPSLDPGVDAASLPAVEGPVMMSVDGFTVQPLIFPGGSIGSLAIHGTVNDLAVSGAIPRYLSLSAIIEEGLELPLLEQIVIDMAQAAKNAGVRIVCGDTKIVPHGEGSGIYLSTTGIGTRQPGVELGMKRIRDGDSILVSGPVGDHGAAIMLAREQFGLKGDLQSDADSVLPLCQALYDIPGVRFLRDPTRGGMATVLHEISHATGLGISLHEPDIPVRDTVRSICEILGYDPLYLACEGRVIAVVDNEYSQQVLSRWQACPGGKDASQVGIMTNVCSEVELRTGLGGNRLLHELEDDPLPRIC